MCTGGESNQGPLGQKSDDLSTVLLCPEFRKKKVLYFGALFLSAHTYIVEIICVLIGPKAIYQYLKRTEIINHHFKFHHHLYYDSLYSDISVNHTATKIALCRTPINGWQIVIFTYICSKYCLWVLR